LSEKKPEAFLKLVFPKLYGVPADEAEQNGLVADNEDLETGKDLIDIVNEYGRNRGKFQKGSNKNPTTGTGGRTKKPTEEKPEETSEKPVDEPTDEEPTDEESTAEKSTDEASEDKNEDKK
jgi:hypothetical protein